MRKHTRATIEITGLIAAAIEAKRADELQAYAKVEAIPEGQELKWLVTPEQVARINAGEREALDKFYFDNLQRLTFSAYRFMRNNAFVKAVASYEDLLQQVYFDLRTGVLKLRPYDRAICAAVYHSFRYAAVGGFEELYIYEDKRKKQCQKAAN